MNKGPEVKETAFLYFHISLFACSHNTCSPSSDYIRCRRTRVFKRQTTRYVENTGKRSHSLPASLAPLEIKNHASAMYWFKPLTFACHRIPEKNGHIKVITSAYATLTCPFSPGMG